jgi:hypothetical protein
MTLSKWFATPYAVYTRVNQVKKLFHHYLENSRVYFIYICAFHVLVIRKFNTLFLALCLLAWSVITPVQAGQGEQGFKAASGKVVLQNLTTASVSSENVVKKLTDSVAGNAAQFGISGYLILPAHSGLSLHGFVYRHPVYNTLSAQAP